MTVTAADISSSLPDILNPAKALATIPALPEHIAALVSDWVFDRVLNALEQDALVAADAEPEEWARHQQAYAIGRLTAERARNGFQWWVGDMWAAAAASAVGHDMDQGSAAHRTLCHRALRSVVRAHEVHEARMAGTYDDDRDAVAWPAMSSAPAQPNSATNFPLQYRATPKVHASADATWKKAAELHGEPVAGSAQIQKASAAEPSSVQPSGRHRDLHLDEAFEITRKFKVKAEWKCPKTADQARRALTLFMKVTGLTHVSQVTRGHVLDFREKLCELPSMKGRSIYADLADLEQIALADKLEALRERARIGDRDARREISQLLKGRKVTIDQLCARAAIPTINRYLSQLGAVFEKPLDDEGNEVETHPAFRSVQYPRDKGKKGQVTPTRNFEEHELEAIFRTDKLQAELRKKSDRFWGLLLSGLHGLRRAETAQLQPFDFRFGEDVPIIVLEHATKELKTEASERILPIHPLAIEFGLEETVLKAKANKQKALLPSFAWKDNEMERGRDLSRWFAEVLEEAGIKAPGKSLKSLRKDFNTDLTRNGVNDAARHYLMGHAHDGVNLNHYFGGFRPEDVARLITGTRFERVVRRCLLEKDRKDGNVVPFAAAA